jgi:hypothetical protein
LRLIVKERTTRTNGERVVLKGHFHISTQELCDALVEPEKDTKTKVVKIVKKKSKTISYEAASQVEVEEECQEESESDTIPYLLAYKTPLRYKTPPHIRPPLREGTCLARAT